MRKALSALKRNNKDNSFAVLVQRGTNNALLPVSLSTQHNRKASSISKSAPLFLNHLSQTIQLQQKLHKQKHRNINVRNNFLNVPILRPSPQKSPLRTLRLLFPFAKALRRYHLHPQHDHNSPPRTLRTLCLANRSENSP